MNKRSSREEALAKTIDFLRDEYPRAKKSDVTAGSLLVAFPKGFVPDFDDDGRLLAISIVPEDPQDVYNLLKEVEYSRVAYDALVAWASAQLLANSSIPNRDVAQFLVSHLLGSNTRPTKRGRYTKNVSKNFQYAILRCAVALLEREGFKTTRNQATVHRNSACDIVAEAMAVLGFIPQSFGEIKAILGSGDRVG